MCMCLCVDEYAGIFKMGWEDGLLNKKEEMKKKNMKTFSLKLRLPAIMIITKTQFMA